MRLNPFRLIRGLIRLQDDLTDTYAWIQAYVLPQLNEETRAELSQRVYDIKKSVKDLL